jgi:hypothetical protein
MDLNELGPLNIYLKLEIGPKKRRANCGPKRDFFPPLFFFILFYLQHLHSIAQDKTNKRKLD